MELLSTIAAIFSGSTLILVVSVALRFGEWKGTVDTKLENIQKQLNEHLARHDAT